MGTARPDVLDPASPARRVVEALADTWAQLVVCALHGGQLRYGEVGRAVEGISEQTLPATLRKLIRHGLVERLRDGDGYRLTPLGRSLHDEVLVPLFTWAQAHALEMQPPPRTSASGGGCARPER